MLVIFLDVLIIHIAVVALMCCAKGTIKLLMVFEFTQRQFTMQSSMSWKETSHNTGLMFDSWF
jgi:hypothetical protein